MYMFYVLIITHLYSNISQASDIFVQNLFVDNYSYLQTTLSTTVSANPDSISILYAFSGASLDQAMTSTRYSTLLGIFFHYSYPTRKFYYSAEQRVMAMKAATFQNWVLTTNLFHFCLSFKYHLFPEMINLALNALSLFIF